MVAENRLWAQSTHGPPCLRNYRWNHRVFREDLVEMEPWERARAGLFLPSNTHKPSPGFQVGNFLRKSVQGPFPGENAPGARDFRAS
ncbi:MAG: hypothetical protein Ct9H90mP16_10280 [Candidatus Poseidoniales archaeon]|nr:MAG: hypothetical protein Ct9H90mP16_10280 [Candidatus Poseidoniales archaeon]